MTGFELDETRKAADEVPAANDSRSSISQQDTLEGEVDDHLHEMVRRNRSANRGVHDDHQFNEVHAALFGEPVAATRIARFTVLKTLGRGGMGVVYAAHDPDLDRDIAVKLVRNDIAVGARHRVRLRREAQAMAQLSHPNVVQVYEVGEHDGQLFIAMELVRGQTLGDWVQALGEPKQRARRWRTVVEKFVQAGRGLAAAHEVGLVHRDFKPANALVGDDGRVRVLDFGLARAGLERSPETKLQNRTGSTPLSTTLTATGAIMGTPAYTSPEQLEGERAGPASDQFSFCVSLYEALLGVRPYGGTSLIELIQNMHSAVRKLPAQGVSIPSWLAAVLDRGLAIDPAMRWPSMTALIEALLDDPARRRRRRAAFACGLAIVGAVGVGSWLHQQEQRAECVAAGDTVNEFWNPAQGEAIRTAFAATQLEYADDTAGRVESRLDDWQAAWTGARVEACTARQAGDPHAHARETCLDRQLWQLASTVRVLGTADRPVVTHAVLMASELPLPQSCETAGELLAKANFTDKRSKLTTVDSRESIEFDRIRARLVDAEVAAFAGRYEQARLYAEESLAEANVIGDDALRAESLRTLGTVSSSLGEHAEGAKHLRAAFFSASGIAYDPLVARSAVELMSTVGYSQAKTDAGFAWADHARAATRRMGQSEPGPVFHESLGNIHIAAGEYQKAIEAYERARERIIQTRGAGHPSLARIFSDLGTAHRALGEYDKAGRLLERALEIIEEAQGPNHPDVALVLANLGLLASDRGQSDEAEKLYRRALSQLESAFGPKHPDIATTLGFLGNLLRRRGELDQALDLHRRAVEIADSLDREHPDAASFHAYLGSTLQQLGKLDEAEFHLRDSLKRLERALGPEHPALAESLGKLGFVLEQTGNLEQALTHYRRALELEQRALGPDHPDLALSLDDIGVVQRRLGQLDAALQSHQRALTIRERALPPEHSSFAASYDSIGQVLMAQGAHREAIDWHRRALVVREATRGPKHRLTGRTCRRLADALYASGAFDEARASYTRAKSIQEQAGARPDELARSLTGLARLSLDKREVDVAIKLLEQAFSLRKETREQHELEDTRMLLIRALQTSKSPQARARLRELEQPH